MPLFNIVITKESNDSAFTNDCCPFDFGSVMGQEDLFREDPPGTRVENTLQARIVWATTVPATSRVIWSQIDDVGFLNDTGVVATDQTFHQVLFPVSQVNTEYKFQIISTSDVCDPGGETVQSGTFYFEVGGEISLGTDEFELSAFLVIIPATGISINLEDKISGEYHTDTEDIQSQIDYEFGLSFAALPPERLQQTDLSNSELYTNYSTSVT